MADLKISQLTDGGDVVPGDMIPAVRAGNNVRVSIPGSSTVVVEHVPAGTAWAATITPASFVTRAGFAGGSTTITPVGVTSPSANIVIDYSNDYNTVLSSATLDTISANGAKTVTLPTFTTMPGLCFRIKLSSGTGTGGTVGITLTLS